MKRCIPPKGGVALALLLLVPLAASQEGGTRKIPIATETLRGNVHLLSSGQGGNLVALTGEDGTLLVDADYAEFSESIEEALRRIDERPVRFLVNTHWHFDHVGGNEHFAGRGALVIAQENVRERMAGDRHLDLIDVDVPASTATALPAITFDHRLTLHQNGEEVTVLHLPRAHTGGDAVVRFEGANVLHVGDLIFAGGYPYIDLANGGSIEGLIDAVAAVVELTDDETRVVPGHGPPVDRAFVEEYLTMLRAFRGAIADEVESGADLQAILEHRPTASLDEKWGRNAFSPAQFSEIVYLSLTGE